MWSRWVGGKAKSLVRLGEAAVMMERCLVWRPERAKEGYPDGERGFAR